jgi:geranylgeranyl diphosphate synthase type I
LTGNRANTERTCAINVQTAVEELQTHLLERELRATIDQLEGMAPLLSRMARFHLGWVDPAGAPTDEATRRTVQGKRIRPRLAFLSCAAVHGDPAAAAPLAAAIELLHNFTLIHDDIQDRSPNRRHRATVWRIWGDAQAINAGDALFAMAQRTLLRTNRDAIGADVLLRLIDEFNRVTVEIVRGQVLDLEFENQDSVSPQDYLTMIGGKTAAIVRFAAWAGAVVGGASESDAERLAEVGEALGMGFQVRDDVLGIWGTRDDTGKDQADDIRRRKKSLPILMLMERTQDGEVERLAELYRQDEVGSDGIDDVLDLLGQHGIEALATVQVRHFHETAETALEEARPNLEPTAAAAIGRLIRHLDTRGS